MKQKIRNSYTTLLLMVCMCVAAVAQRAVPELWNTRVHDDAHVLRQETIDRLEKELAHYEDSTSNQIAVLIITSLEGENIEGYSLKVSEKWKLGKKEKDNGVLLLIAVDDHEMRIEVGQGLEGVLTDAQCNRIIRNEMAPHFRRADFDSGVSAALHAIIATIGGEYNAADTNEIGELSFTMRLIIGLVLYAFLSVFAFFALVIPGGWGWAVYAFLIPFFSIFPALVVPVEFWYVPGLSFILLFPLLKLWVGRTAWGERMAKKVATSSTGSGGGWSSGSSWGSGGSSFGGGSSFSGGGGSFGGGGSSGSW